MSGSHRHDSDGPLGTEKAQDRAHAPHKPHEPLGGAAPDPEAHRLPLASGAGKGKVLYLDAFSGIAGDMTIAALIDLGVPSAVVRDAVAALPLPGVELVTSSRPVGALGATHFDVQVIGSHPERAYGEIDAMIAGSSLEPGVKILARRIFETLALAESRVHRVSLDEVHFHEVGAVDAIVDIVGAAACLVHLGAEVVASPLPLGRGFVTCRHGVLPLPAPATVECLKGAPTYDAGLEAELVTPTGAAIVATAAERFGSWPDLTPERVGWGRGTHDFDDRPNALRVVLGAPVAKAGPPSDRTTHTVIEATVDDMTGEIAAHALDSILAAGALDVWLTPVTMKKGRPGLVVSALADAARASAVAEAVLRHTTSIGVRLLDVARVERPRRIVQVDTRFGPVSVKISEGPYGTPEVKPEFDVCARLADQAGVSVREVIEAARRAVDP